MQCKGYGQQTPHEVDTLYACGQCDKCYHKQYYEEHKAAIIKYQKQYQREYRKFYDIS